MDNTENKDLQKRFEEAAKQVLEEMSKPLSEENQKILNEVGKELMEHPWDFV